MNELVEAFDRYFEVIFADTPQLREQVFRLRYQVYCVETKFLDAQQSPNGMESDEFDRRSRHVLLRHRATGWWAGTVRLVLPARENVEALFPVELVCPDILAPGSAGFVTRPRERTAEMSRFAVSKEFRRRHAEYLSPSGTPQLEYAERNATHAPPSEPYRPGQIEPRTADQERRVVPHIALGLMQGVIGASASNQITCWCAAMEPTLLRLLSRVGIYVRNIGPLIEYHGTRQPCIAYPDELLARVKAERPDVWELIAKFWPEKDEERF